MMVMVMIGNNIIVIIDDIYSSVGVELNMLMVMLIFRSGSW